MKQAYTNRLTLAVLLFLIVVSLLISLIVKRCSVKRHYLPLTTTQDSMLAWQQYDDEKSHHARYMRCARDSSYFFPRQTVYAVKMYRQNGLIGFRTSNAALLKNVNGIVAFCNDTLNFDWGETTWDKSEAEYVLNFYDSADFEIGKMYVCLKDCGMTLAEPRCPAMKYGALSETGKAKIKSLLQGQ